MRRAITQYTTIRARNGKLVHAIAWAQKLAACGRKVVGPVVPRADGGPARVTCAACKLAMFFPVKGRR